MSTQARARQSAETEMASATEAGMGPSTPLSEATGRGAPGRTEVADSVIAAIAGNAAQSVEGVVRIGGGNIMRAFTGAAGSGQRSKGAGIEVEAGQKEAVFDMNLTVMYGRPIPEIVASVREAVTSAIEAQVGLTVKEINIEISSIEFATQSGRSRVE